MLHFICYVFQICKFKYYSYFLNKTQHRQLKCKDPQQQLNIIKLYTSNHFNDKFERISHPSSEINLKFPQNHS